MKIYLDINQFGTPHWLGELANIDPTTIREYNKQQWINAMKAKTEAAYAARKVRVLGDAGFDEDQPRDEEGQWTSGGPVKLKLGGKMRTLSRDDWGSTKATLDLFKGAYMNPMNDQEMIWAWEKDGEEGQLLAFMEFGPAHDEETIYLKHIRSFPQRKGAGRLAMEKLMQYAGEKKMGIYLDVARNSQTPYKALRKFYTGLGFKGKGDSLIWRP